MLLDRIPELDRPQFLADLIASLKPNDEPTVKFAASLVARNPDTETIQVFTDFLESSLRNGEVHLVAAICEEHQVFGDALLNRVVRVVGQCHADETFPSEVPKSFLQFSVSSAFRQSWSEAHSQLFDYCLDLLQSQSRDSQAVAKDAVLDMLTIQDLRPIEDRVLAAKQLWSYIQRQLGSGSNPVQPTTYAIWLRWLSTSQVDAMQSFDQNEYLDFLRRGLRHGDTEQRKLCLNILKIPVFADGNCIAPSPALNGPFDRFITVFDTVVLGRYINQVIECEGDLNAFAKNGELDASWLYALLGSALDNRMQDSNRKWIGKWIMRSGLGASEKMLDFLRKDFLPWAIQGQHFVATLKRVDGAIVCRHGDELASFIRALRTDSAYSAAVTGIIVDAIAERKHTMFAHCIVYLLEGLDRSLDDDQRKAIAAIRGLPEVVRDYVFSQVSSSSAPQDGAAPTKKNVNEQRTLDKMMQYQPTIEALEVIWTDVEYLEFPKKLLLALPSTLLNQTSLEKAQADDHFAICICEKIRILHGVAASKTFLFPPLMVALREAIITVPRSVEFVDVTGSVINAAAHTPQHNIDFMLEEAVIKLTPYTYDHYFGERLGYGIAAYLDLISRLGGHQEILKTILDRILWWWRSQKVPPPVVSAWKNTLQLQVLFLCCEQYRPSSSGESASFLEDLFYILAIEPLPNYRYLLEATIVQMIIRQNLHQNVIDRLKTKDHHSNPKHLASLMKIGGILASTSDATEEFAQQLTLTFVSLAASSKVVVRHEAQWQVPILMDHARSQSWTSITENPALTALDDFIRSLARFDDPPLERQVGKYDPETECTMTNLVDGRWFELDPTESRLTSRDDFVKLNNQEALSNAPPPCIPLGPPILRPQKPTPDPSPTPTLSTTSPHPGPSDLLRTALQTKGAAQLSRTLSSTTLTTRPNPDLLVIASLVDNPHNLGGLSRVCEIFGAAALTVQNQNVLSNKDFLAVSVSSHLHFPIQQLSAAGVPEYLRERKRKGYTVVGIEQTDRSVVLGAEGVRLPRKCVLVVGSEREGIPAGVLVECGVLVEIRQEGVTRSLNVQTAVGIVLYEYGRQFGGSKGKVEEFGGRDGGL